MNQQSVVLRSAKPAFDEGLAFARYLDEAAEGFFRFMLGRRVAEIIATAYTQPDHNYSYKNVTFAEREGVIVGMASGYTAEQHRRFSDEPLKQAAGSAALRMKCVRVLFAPLWGLLETLADGEFYLQAVAVNTELRGEGAGSVLMDHIEDRARASGSSRLSLDVSAKNKGARRLYARRGMTVASEWPDFWFVPPILVRMTKLL